MSQILLNYAVRLGRKPIFVDLDVGQGCVSVPGTIGAMLVERPASVEEGFSQNSPLVYHYGHTTPGHNNVLYKELVSRWRRGPGPGTSANPSVLQAGGRGAGAAEGEQEGGRVRRGDQHLRLGPGRGVRSHQTHCAGRDARARLHYFRIRPFADILLNVRIFQAFEIDVIIVLDQERVYNVLVKDMPNFVKVVLQPKSGGVVSRNKEQRAEGRDSRIKQYFYGPRNNLFPHSFEVNFSDIKDKLYKIGAPELPDSCLPLGMKITNNKTKLVAVNPNPRELLNRILSVSFTSAVEDVIMTNVAGFVVVTDVKMEEQKMMVLSPQPRPLPDTLLLLSDVQYVDST